MRKHKRLITIASLIALTSGGCTKIESKAPNILIIVADDLGFSDLGCYGSEIQTNNIDQLAENGIRFTQFYTSARCCPSRASLLTGQYPHQTGIGAFVGPDRGYPGYKGRLNEINVTLAEVLQSAGYRTFGAGKWHVNDPGPVDRGFEEFYGFLDDYGIDGWRPKWMKRYPEGRPERAYEPGEFFATTAITDYAIDFLKMAEDTPDKPWFLYLSYQAPHFPLQAPENDIAKYKDTYKVGWDVIRENRLTRMKQLGVVSDDIILSERGEIPLEKIARRNGVPGDGIHNPAWEILDADRQADLARRMAVFAGMVDNMDQNIGRVVDYLKRNGKLENTLIVFTSDNGACAEWDPFGFEFPDRNARIAGGTPGHPNVLHKGESLDSLGLEGGPLFSYGSGWANVGNTPLSLYKQYVHEGGISAPLIIHWPKANMKPDIFNDFYGHVNDIMATCVEVSGATYPVEHKENLINPMEGISLFKTLRGEVDPERILIFEHMGNPAIRKGDWKLVGRSGSLLKNEIKDDASFELYNILLDRSETNNLAQKYPEKVEELKKLMADEFYRTYVFPKP